MDIWKVELDLKSFKDTIYTEDEIKKISTMMESAYVHKEYFNDDQKSKPNYIHIFIVSTDTSTEVKDISDDIVKELVKPPSKLPDKTRNFLNQKPDYKFTKLIGRLIFPSSVGKNEDSFHGFWDDIIKNTILTLGKGIVSLAIMAFNQNINKKTSAGKKKVEISTADVSKELTDKFKEWTYGDAPYLFAYYAIGQFVTFVLLTESESKNIRSFIAYYSKFMPVRDTPNFFTLRRENGTIVELGYHVKKIFKKERSVVHLKEIYAILSQNNVRFTNKLEYSSSHSVHLEPRGLQRKSKDLNELLKALICILTYFKEMHNIKPKPILHRDVRKHDRKVDIWGVGYLIDSCDIEGKPKQLKEFASKWQDKKPKNRPTASDALEDIIKIFMEIIIH
ncbi:hypothetical protein RhiirA1_472601 [Rhizophagus irregularis]|uniref:Protein kinase domain-containing protein n=1 Tax=Rhizophagus irregularis TaxID=588596 RepID=A0A2N0R232_9GLOM|nr:hypothetical protein RhiirA1_472601 [Rhizophagus irregularis]